MNSNRYSRRTWFEVTGDRLRELVEKHHDQLSGAERDEVSHVIQILEELNDGDR